MSMIDEIMDQVGKYAIAWTDACTCEMCDEHITHLNQLAVKLDLRNMIAAALSDAERKGAEAMREACATASEEIARRFSGRKPTVQFSNGAAAAAKTIRDLSLPTGSQPAEAVQLTDASQDDDDPWLSGDDLMGSSG